MDICKQNYFLRINCEKLFLMNNVWLFNSVSFFKLKNMKNMEYYSWF